MTGKQIVLIAWRILVVSWTLCFLACVGIGVSVVMGTK